MVRRRVPLLALALALVLGGLWWWAVLRLALVPGQAGLVEGTMAAGGWGLSLLPVHVASARTPRYAPRATRAWPRRRWGAGSDPS
ncbi:hypothetical protein [Streptomyces sp. CB03238]|uniref:hypothetical protein n=1 Tax=Streptomyces sp. CB03238 TaxID=1907777 RepID=UPI000A123210|nr:hypothetical protein [Streptomyces sp. CB03238]ORT55005.1 hypothetical protein BKD26_33290 [Streptomyces sp. CB03238]